MARSSEQVAEKLPRRVADDHLPRLGQRLQPRGEVGRVAHHRLLLRVRLADEVAHDHQPGGDADPAGERAPRRRCSRATAATIASPARTARSASSSCARGQPK